MKVTTFVSAATLSAVCMFGTADHARAADNGIWWQYATHTTAEAGPGAVIVRARGDRPHAFVVWESTTSKNPAGVRWASLVPFVPAFLQEASRQISLGELMPAAVEPSPQLVATSLLALVWVALTLQGDNRIDKTEPGGVLVVADSLGPIEPEDATGRCVPSVREWHGWKLQGAVECTLEPTPAGVAPTLNIEGGNMNDTVILDLHCGVCTSGRVVFGYGGNDLILGSPFSDTLSGFYGNDTISGGGGDDFIGGFQAHEDLTRNIIGPQPGDYPSDAAPSGVDDDRLFGDGGRDVILGQGGDDLIDGGPGNDDRVVNIERAGEVDALPSSVPETVPFALSGGPGSDVVIGGAGRDRMEGGPGRDMLLARESDFGWLDTVDSVVDCGPNYLDLPASPEVYRRSEGDPLATCTKKLASAPTSGSLFQRAPGQEWPF